ncbi:DUF1501 domain-containing protein [Silvimonas sp.]|uniref:DUF1501 domain-containing protein n=1 Tax=Silvimonas sp. TaxID=2650811 RepID=UPI0028474358|nr:DUF1501 domain-containing protein [Silvimonas sp.]MDR3426559.1 DUF1501 domain-containing protein [Silvimonas sp.]
MTDAIADFSPERRRVLQLMALAAGATTLSWSGKLFAAASNTDTRFLLVFLRGGYDASSLLVPISSDDYYSVRPNISIAKTQALPLSTDWGLHPALKDSLYPLWQRSEIAFVPFAGTDDLTRSHFETQDSIELGQPVSGHRDYQSGFINRLAAQIQGIPAISFTGTLPICCSGGINIPNVALQDANHSPFDERQSKLLAAMYSNTALAQQVHEGLNLRQDVAKMLQDEMTAANRGAASSTAFENQARRMGKLMREQYRLGFVDVGGWDTHVNQGNANGALATNLNNLGKGLAAFAQETGDTWSKTVVVVVSEFGRTFRENGNKGTDHGHGSVYWVMGGGIRGGQIAGQQSAVSIATLFQNRDWPVLNDYRSMLGGMFGHMYGLSGKQLDAVFPGVRAVDMGLV